MFFVTSKKTESNEQRTLVFKQGSFAYVLKRNNKVRHIRLTICRDGSCTVTAPQKVQQEYIEAFLKEKEAWIMKKILYFQKNPRLVISDGSNEDFLRHKKSAHTLVVKRLEFFNQYYGFSWNKVTIKNVITRWGSCSKKGNLNFSYKLTLLPEYLSDYIVVHELCHLKEMNHGEHFWKLVEKTIPEYKQYRRELKNIV